MISIFPHVIGTQIFFYLLILWQILLVIFVNSVIEIIIIDKELHFDIVC
jgi:hypothetical protein